MKLSQIIIGIIFRFLLWQCISDVTATTTNCSRHFHDKRVLQMQSFSCSNSEESKLPIRKYHSEFVANKSDNCGKRTHFDKEFSLDRENPHVFQLKLVRSHGYMAVMPDLSLAVTANKSSVFTYFRLTNCTIQCNGRKDPVEHIEAVFWDGKAVERKLWLVVQDNKLKATSQFVQKIGDLTRCQHIDNEQFNPHFVFKEINI